MDNILEIQGLCKKYKGFELKDVSFSLPRGYIMGFVGQNGSGKTTTIRSILNMANIDSGKISVFGLSSIADSKQIKENTGVVFDNLYFAEHLKITDIEKLLKGFYKNWDREEFFNRVNSFKLPLKKKLATFSRGMKMKLMVAVALSHKAELLILDEPTSGLDPVARDELLDILTEYIESENRGILFSTHITADVERVADYITVLHNGKVWFSGTKDDLLEKYVIIKGGNEDITVELKNKTFGFHSYKNGFDALLDAEFLNEIPKEIDYEKANLDEILVYIAKENHKEEQNERNS